MAAAEADLTASSKFEEEDDVESENEVCGSFDNDVCPEESAWREHLKATKFHDYEGYTLKANPKKKKKGKKVTQPQSSKCKQPAPEMMACTEEVPEVDTSCTEEVTEDDTCTAKDDKEAGSEDDGSNSFTSTTAAPLPSPEEVVPENRKKSRMKTASEVISRILWDPDLPAESFDVGYLDRFVGLVEKPFQFFSWDDLATVDYNVLAVPKHRIVYFKCRGFKVWDKNERLDLIFGSTETSKTMDIRELVQLLEKEHQDKSKLDDISEGQCRYRFNDDDDDDVCVSLDVTPAAAQLKQSWRQKLPETRPNYFVAVRVTDPETVAKVAEVKQLMVAKERRLAQFLMPDGSLHITLAMLRLNDAAEVANAVQALDSCRQHLADLLRNPVAVRLAGLETFSAAVLYVAVHAPPAFYRLHEGLLARLTACNVALAHAHDFVPHLTLLKLTRSRSRVLDSPYLDPYVYQEWRNVEFGTIKCDNLHLCVIGEEKRWDGFYQSAVEVRFE